MRSWSIPIGRLFGVDVRLHLTFVILPMFIYWTEYAVRQTAANGPRDVALSGIILACVAAHELGHMLVSRRFGMIPKAVILLPITGVALYDEGRLDRQNVPTWKREIVLAAIGPLTSIAVAGISAAVITVALPGVDLWKWQFPLGTSNLTIHEYTMKLQRSYL